MKFFVNPWLSFAWLFVKAAFFVVMSMDVVDIIVVAYQRF